MLGNSTGVAPPEGGTGPAHRLSLGERRLLARLNQPVTNFIARLPLRLELKLLVAFLGAIGLLVLLGAAGLAVQAANGRRTETLIATQRRIDGYQHLEHHAHELLITVSSGLWMPGVMVDPALQINHLRESLAEPGPSDDTPQRSELHHEYGVFIDTANREVALLRRGDIDLAGAVQTEQLLPQAAKIEALTDQLIRGAEAEMESAIAATHRVFYVTRNVLIVFIVGAALFGGYLAHTTANFVVGPLREIGVRLGLIATGDFAQRVTVPNRDEIGELAQNLNRTSEQLGQLYTELEIEKERAEELLYHTLPRRIVQRLKDGESLIADRVDAATILFSDLAGFTEIADHIAPEEVLDVLDILFARYDSIAKRLGLEKIKTIGDGYMVAGGIPEARPDHAAAVAEMALAMRAATDIATRALGAIGTPLRVRIGINSGPLVAGVIGNTKMVYDVWGDTVNTASRMEHYGEPGRIAVSAATRAMLGNLYRFEPREIIEVKGKGAMETYFLERHIGPRPYRGINQRLAARRTGA